MINKKDITGIILAGGKSSRMGTDKGFLKLNGKLFIEYSIEALKPLVSQIVIVSNNSEYDIFNVKRVEDIIKDSGPLAGIYSGLKHSETEYNLVLSCDIPLINTKVLKKLIETNGDDFDVIQTVSNGRQMPLIALYKKSCEEPFYKFLKNNERRMHIAINQLKVKNIILKSEFEVFTENINTPKELEKITNGVEY